MVRVLVTTSPVSKLNQTKGDRHRNAGEVANDVQDVQDDSQSTVAMVGSWYKITRLAMVVVARSWVIASAWLSVGRSAQTDETVY
jgi:hypothetical protein